MRVIISSLQVTRGASKGHLHPLLGVAQELHAEGHEVLWLPLPSPMGDDDRSKLEASGIRVLEPPALPSGVLKSPEELARLASDPKTVWKAYESFLLSPLPYQVQGVRQMLRLLRPDAVASDMMSYSALLGARLEGVPEIGICAGLKALAPDSFPGHYYGDLEPLRPIRARLMADLGVQANFRLLECLSPQANVVFGTAAFAGALQGNPPKTTLAGPVQFRMRREDEGEDASDAGINPTRDYVYMAFGSIYDPAHFPGLPEAVSAITGERGLRLFLGSKVLSESQHSLPSHVTVRAYLPQRRLLPGTKLFITHGGANSVMEGILAGVPQLVLPVSADQPLQARLVTETGIGLAIDPREATRPRLEELLGRLLVPNSSFARRAKELSEDYRRFNGSKKAAEIVLATARGTR